MKYRIEWMREKKNVLWQAKQQCVVYDDESALHIMKNLKKDPAETDCDEGYTLEEYMQNYGNV